MSELENTNLRPALFQLQLFLLLVADVSLGARRLRGNGRCTAHDGNGDGFGDGDGDGKYEEEKTQQGNLCCVP